MLQINGDGIETFDDFQLVMDYLFKFVKPSLHDNVKKYSSEEELKNKFGMTVLDSVKLWLITTNKWADDQDYLCDIARQLKEDKM